MLAGKVSLSLPKQTQLGDIYPVLVWAQRRVIVPFWSGFEVTLTHPTDTSHYKRLHLTLPTFNSHLLSMPYLMVFKTLRAFPSSEAAKGN